MDTVKIDSLSTVGSPNGLGACVESDGAEQEL